MIVVVVDVVEIVWAVVEILRMIIRRMDRRGLVRVGGGRGVIVGVVERMAFFWVGVVVGIGVIIIIIIVVIEFIVFLLFVVVVEFPCFSC